MLASDDRSILITAGPTHEPIDAVRYIGNRSSGRLGIALAESAAGAGWRVTLLLGPTSRTCTDSKVRVLRFHTAAELQALLVETFPQHRVLVMAAAVADYRPVAGQIDPQGKLRREGHAITLHLEPTPDLLAECSSRRKPSQILVGFALEPRERMLTSAKDKLARKGIDLIVANPLETMDGETVEATVISREGGGTHTNGPMSKEAFAPWLLETIERSGASKRS